MNAPAPPSKTATPPAAGADGGATTVAVSSGWGAVMGVAVLIPALFLLAFHVGAGYLSYQKYSSIGWAFLDFIFAYFYYPYYAFYLAKDPGPSMGLIGGRRGGVVKMLSALFKA